MARPTVFFGIQVMMLSKNVLRRCVTRRGVAFLTLLACIPLQPVVSVRAAALTGTNLWTGFDDGFSYNDQFNWSPNTVPNSSLTAVLFGGMDMGTGAFFSQMSGTIAMGKLMFTNSLDVTTVALTRELLKRDILVLSAGCTTGGLANCGFCSPAAKEWAGPGLRAVCDKLGIPPVLNFGPCLAIGRIELVAAELAQLMGIDIPQLPVVISAPQWLEEQALADGCFGLALGLTVHLAQPPAILGSALVTKVLTEDLPGITGGRVLVEMDPVKAADQFAAIMTQKKRALGIGGAA